MAMSLWPRFLTHSIDFLRRRGAVGVDRNLKSAIKLYQFQNTDGSQNQ